MTDSEDSPLYAVEAVKDDNLMEMDKVFDDTERLMLFREYAQNGLLLENVDFIQAINEFKSMAEDHIVRSSVTANQDIKSDAKAIFEQFIKVNLSKFMSYHSISQRLISNLLRTKIISHHPASLHLFIIYIGGLRQ